MSSSKIGNSTPPDVFAAKEKKIVRRQPSVGGGGCWCHTLDHPEELHLKGFSSTRAAPSTKQRPRRRLALRDEDRVEVYYRLLQSL